ncbi:Mrp/NBP35 family ATP-binding protein [uncultured Phascolarctobacterium sp.]|uniref:Mrp/NBP35 family ATP-binding protein n=1 Tax=uncultured Phascolarctobacterium sp. TaxID=512296 RepID=UPI002630BB17|nr:Mrp/NBP35 family ATP-binding protein [uncultured Phascolarctobacterium sp.]
MSNEKQCKNSSSCGRESCEGCPSAQGAHKPEDLRAHLNQVSSVKKVIAVVSGKGGVGKSLVTSLMASAIQRRGNRCGVLDADITGPSMAKNFGVQGKAQATELGIIPRTSSSGVQVISANMFLPNESDPVVWRGPLLAGMVKQFWTDVIWNDIDYMFVDMPPGTGDVPLTVFQSLPVDGIIVVTSPQELVSMIVAKAVKMAQMMDIPILGLIENYAYFHCPDNGKDYEIFGPSHLQETANTYGLKVLARLPIDPAVAAACDAGEIESVQLPAIDACCDYITQNLNK